MIQREKPLIIPVFIPHMGCPHRCVFCNQTGITGRTGQVPEAGRINRTIEKYLQYKGGRTHVELAFFGGNFLGLPREQVCDLLNIVRPYFENGKIDGLRFSTRPDTISSRTLEWIAGCPVAAVEVGVQSMDNAVLKAAGRGHTADDTVRALALLKERGHRTGVQVMVGLPSDSEDALIASTRKLADLAPDFARIYPLLVLSGSPLATAYKSGTYIPLTLDCSVKLVKKMVYIFDEAGVRIIRMGLQASRMMTGGKGVLAGPWHPAFGQLVRSSTLYDEVVRQVGGPDLPDTAKITLSVHPRSESGLRGDKNTNFERLAKRFPGNAFEIVRDGDMALGRVQARVS